MINEIKDIADIAEIMLSLSDEQRKMLLTQSRDMQFDNIKERDPDIEDSVKWLAEILQKLSEDEQRKAYEFIKSVKENGKTAEISFNVKV